MITWRDGPDLVLPRPGAAGLARAAARGVPLVLLLGAGLAVTALLRLVEAPLCGRGRPVTAWITVGVCRAALALLGLRVRRRGRRARVAAVVANHSSWLDILVLNAHGPLVFVAKSEVAGWPGIGLLARATGTLFVRREARGEAAAQADALARALGAGATLALFPEGTSTDGRRVLPFRSSLFEGLRGPGRLVQPVTLAWEAPAGEDSRFYAWFGGAGFGPHALAVLAARRQGGVRLSYHAPLRGDASDRKSLARQAEAAVRSAL